MGFLDKIKGLVKGRETEIKGGIDKVSDTVEQKVPAHADKIDAASDKAKDVVDQISGKDAAAPAASTPKAPVDEPTAATPPPAPPQH